MRYCAPKAFHWNEIVVICQANLISSTENERSRFSSTVISGTAGSIHDEDLAPFRSRSMADLTARIGSKKSPTTCDEIFVRQRVSLRAGGVWCDFGDRKSPMT